MAAQLIHERVAERAREAGDAIAIAVSRGPSMTYAELDRRTDAAARELGRRGVGPEVVVAIGLERSPALVVAMLATLKAGGAFLVLDPAYPRARLAMMLDDARPRVAIGELGVLDGLVPAGCDHVAPAELEPTDAPTAPRPPRISPANLAYVVYTSGSTGRPKGALIEHRNLDQAVDAFVAAFGMHAGSRVLQFASPSFDAAYQEILSTLAIGAVVVMAPRGRMLPGPDGLMQLLREERVTLVTLPPSLLAAARLEPLPDLAVVVSAGEACGQDVVDKWAPGRRFLNAYGPSETTVCATVGACASGEARPTIGRAFGQARIDVLGEDGQPLAAGEAGELYVGGPGVGRGYLRSPGATAARFLPDPAARRPGDRRYRTGDVVRTTPDGRVEFVGRVDHQLKVRGFRVEPGEVEVALVRHPEIEQAIVVGRPDPRGGWQLIAYVVGHRPGLDPRALRRWLGGELPAHMIPSAFVVLASLPLSPNGKVDRAALPAPSGRGDRPYVVPRTAHEVTMAEAWQDVLGSPGVGALDDFFELGGHSLLAVRVASLVEAATGVAIPVAALLQAGTLERMAALIERPDDARRETGPLVSLRLREGRPNLFFVHPVTGSPYVFQELARHLEEVSFWALRATAPALGEPLPSLVELAARYLAAIREVQPRGPYRVGGWSAGCMLAFEIARQIHDAGEVVERCIVMDHEPVDATWLARARGNLGAGEMAFADAGYVLVRNLHRAHGSVVAGAYERFRGRSTDEIIDEVARELAHLEILLPGAPRDEVVKLIRIAQMSIDAMLHYQIVRARWPITVVQGADGHPDEPNRPLGLRWAEHSDLPVDVRTAPGGHHTIVFPPNAEALARILADALSQGAG